MMSVLNLEYDEVENRSWGEYIELRNQAFNIGSWRAGGELKLLSDKEELEHAERELARIRAEKGRREKMEERISEAKKTITESRKNKR